MIGAATAEARLREAHWVHLPELRAILALLEGEAGRTRIVGGLVRDTILDLPHAVSDIDIATELLPDDVTERAREAGIAVYPTGIDHGTVTLRHGTVVVEVTTLRQDVETDGRHAIVRFGTDWIADASRRDFTLNALYADMDGALFDPLGGLGDCIDARVRFIGEPAQRIAEDGLRVYRFFRFSASHGREAFDPAGLEACAAAAHSLDHLSAERVGGEIRRMLGLRHVASTLRKGAPASFARRRAISVLPTPVGPIIRMFFGVTSSRRSSGTRLRRQRLRRATATARLASSWPTMKRSSSETISRGERSVMSPR